jgi:hypothetical protein
MFPMPIVLFESQYHPPLPFFTEIIGAEALRLETQEHYHKQTYRNRCLILTAQGVKPLIVPVIDGSRSEKVKITDIEIDYRQNWVHQHWRTIQTAYGGTPYFEYYADYLHDIYVQKHQRLFDLNLAFLLFYLRSLRLRTPIEFTTEYFSAYSATTPLSYSVDQSANEVKDCRDSLTPKTQVTSEPDRKSVQSYPQTFGKDFVPGLSILDLLFMQGPAAGSFLV